MKRKKKTQKQSANWHFTFEQIGRELRKVYQRPERLSRRLRAVVTQLERATMRRGRQGRKDGNY
jgi:hypothetical protein